MTLAEGSVNTVTDSSSYTTFTDQESLEPDGAIFTKTDLVINGTGKLIVNANYSDGIVSKDGLKIVNSNIEIYSEDSISSKGLKAGTELTIDSGTIQIVSTDDSIHSNGIIIINNGTIEASSGDDGIHADTNIVINGGNINITKSYEGIESSYIEINGGTIKVIASDDGINICGGNDMNRGGGMKKGF